MLAEHFAAGSMDGGAGDFAAGWEWDNVMMLPGGQQHLNRKLHSAPSSAWSDEPPVMVVAPPRPPPPPAIASGSGIPGISTTAAARNSLLQPPDGAKTDANGLPASIKHESLELPRSGKPNGVIHHPSSQEKLPSNSSKDFFLGLSGGAKPEGEKNDNGGAASGDAEIGLKLGLKRAFSPDSNSVATSSAGGATTVSASAPTATTTNATNTGNKSSSPGKKPRAANHTPRCQVEGCKTDLTSAKDYHRRHKVCAMHSKSAKVSVNSIEQRFCQQCSRFHVLSEFDEGKRSCRRRLAGHNERRRKPQPDPMALTSVLSPYQAGFMRLAHERLLGYGTPLSYLGVDNVNGKLAWPRFGTLDEHPGLVSGSSSVSRPERFFMLIPPRKTPAMLSNGGAMGHQQQQQQQQQHHHHGVHQFMQGTGSMGQNLTLSSPSAYATGIGIGPPNPAAGSSPHGVNVAGVSDSGRALSLLSSQSWTASPSPHDSMEQLMSENRAAYSSSQQQQPGTSYVSLSQQQVAQVAALDSRNGNHQSQQQQQQGGSGGGSGGGGGGGASFLPGMNSYENHTVLTLLQESELRNLQDQQQQQQQQHARPTIDLMHMSTTPPASAVVIQQQQQQQQSPSDFQVLKPYGSGLYDPHHL